MTPTEPSDLEEAKKTIAMLHQELEVTNREVMLHTLELEARLQACMAELRETQEELQKSNSELLQLTLELEDRVAQRTAELNAANQEVRALNAQLEARVAARTAELEAANKQLEAFSYSVSHDLRAPLRAMEGFSRVLDEEYGAGLDEQGRHYLRRVRDNVRRMGCLIDDLLAFSRLGRQAMHIAPVDTMRLVHEVLEEFDVTGPSAQVRITVHPLPPCQADRSLLKQVFANLLSNAIKYSRNNASPQVEVGCDERDGQKVFWVKDNGVGFDMRYANKLFGVFQRLHRADEFEGTGVGLALAQRILHRHGGTIWAEAEPGKGATFYFTLSDEKK